MPQLIFSEKDREQIAKHGLSEEKVSHQIDNFINGFGYLPIKSAAGVGNGILALTDGEAEKYISLYEDEIKNLDVVKFVPASGAATRMFKDLFSFVNEGKGNPVAEKTVSEITKFAFYPVLPPAISGKDAKTIVESVLDYGASLPKGLIFFHSYPGGPRMAFEEHMVEGALYAGGGGRVKIHFTISAEHRRGFEELLNEVKGNYEKLFGISYDITFSVQDSATDTIAVTPENEPFRNEDGSLLFRPAGHGALIENLNMLDADIVFIKNIDNVAPDRLKSDTVRYKKLLGGILIDLKKKAANIAEGLAAGIETAKAARDFLEKELCCRLPGSFEEMAEDDKKAFLTALLDRPMRVCGMVRNEGEAGGGPFWVINTDGTVSLQIAEPSQINPEQSHLLKEGTHFNPVDIVCAVKDRNGLKFDLRRYTDPSTGFISEKSNDGRKLKAQELPGLWNGSMAHWLTVFVEVPVSTFSPVKEVTDLLRPQHQ